jgi:integrase
VRLKVKHIDSAQKIIRIEQSKGRKDRNVMLSPETLDLLRQWWKVRPARHDVLGSPRIDLTHKFGRISRSFQASETGETPVSEKKHYR